MLKITRLCFLSSAVASIQTISLGMTNIFSYQIFLGISRSSEDLLSVCQKTAEKKLPQKCLFSRAADRLRQHWAIWAISAIKSPYEKDEILT
jgi:hypothetical protein